MHSALVMDLINGAIHFPRTVSTLMSSALLAVRRRTSLLPSGFTAEGITWEAA